MSEQDQPPGAGSPVQPGPPMSVQAPIKDTSINISVLLLAGGGVIVLLIVVIVLVAAFHH